MTKHGIDLNSEAIHEFCRKWKIKELSMFGSILSEDFRPASDVDFLADFGDDPEWDLFDHQDMEDELEQICGRKVDLVSRYAIETSENRFFKHEILATAEPVVAQR